MISAHEALERLREGNARFVAGELVSDELARSARRTELIDGQAPIAVVLGCSDSRAPVELLFDQGLGDLFVIRVAGNIAASTQIGSVEFAVDKFGTPLVVVLGHSDCGAIAATLDDIMSPAEESSPHLVRILEHVRPSVASAIERDGAQDHSRLLDDAVRANVHVSAENLRHGSVILEERIDSGELLIVGAEYCLESGVVDFFDGTPADSQ